MRYRLLCVGRRAHDPLLQLVDTYLQRLNLYAASELQRVRDGIDLKSEGQALLRQLAPQDYVVALDERARQLNTLQLAAQVTAWQQAGKRRVTLIVGGAAGLHAAVHARAQEKLALSALTLPHRLAQVVLLEQLYRVHTILRGAPYHKHDAAQ